MAQSNLRKPGLEFLRVDDFIGTLVDAQTLQTALNMGLVDFLLTHPSSTLEGLGQQLKIDAKGLEFLLHLLQANRVVEQENKLVRLSQSFQDVLVFRDLLEAKVDFANLVAPDVLEFFPDLIHDPARFQTKARLFRLFDYRRCFDTSPENVALTRRWLRFTTCLTRYETLACIQHHDFSRYRTMLDIGGNTGEFVLQICRQHAEMQGTVADLPVVCAVGQEHVHSQPEGNRISFHPCDALADPLPTGFDLVTFKSILHDWPQRQARLFLTRASHCLQPGGTLLIFERGPVEVGERIRSFSHIPMLLFFRSFRSPLLYQEHLEAIGFGNITMQRIDLDMPWFLVSAQLGT